MIIITLSTVVRLDLHSIIHDGIFDSYKGRKNVTSNLIIEF